jgi:hypothetical protein
MNKLEIISKARSLSSKDLAKCLELKFRRQKRELELIPDSLRSQAQNRKLVQLKALASALSN